LNLNFIWHHAILSVYSNTFHASWHFDDQPNILKSERLHLEKLSWEKIKHTWFLVSKGKLKIYRPAACFSFALNYYFGKDDVFGYHIVNLSIHFLASIFLFLFIFHTLNLPQLKAKYGPNSYSIALLATVLWAVNPMQTQAVTYIVQRMASMAGMFYVMSMYFYLKGRTSQNRLPMITHYLFCFVTATLAFASKENAAVLPISIFFLDLFLIQGLERKNIKKNVCVFLALILIPLALNLFLRGPSAFSLERLTTSYLHREYTMLERVLTQPRVILLYLTLLFYPMPGRLSISHDISISYGLFEPLTTILAILFIVFLLGVTIFQSKRWPLPSYCILFFFLNHLIESSVFPLELVFEHRNYIPSMLLFVPVAILIIRGITFFSYKKKMQAVFCLFIILRPYHNLGMYYGTLGDREKEIANYLQAINLTRGSYGETRHVSHYNLALAYNALDREDEAIGHLEKTIEMDPGFSDAYANLAAILIKRRKYDKAFDHLIKALTTNDKNPAAHHNLGLVLLKKRRLDEAVSEFKKALPTKKESVPTLLGLGIAYKYKKEFFKAEYYLRRALEKNEKNTMTRLHLIETLFLMQKRDSLEALLQETLDVIPPEIMKAVVEDIDADNFPDQEAPDLQVTLPLLGNAYLKRSDTLKEYGYGYLEKGK
jgi:tetratricopeptide (TPR) repeat protein